MLDVMDEARVRAGEAHAAWSESFNEMFAGVAGEFENAGSPLVIVFKTATGGTSKCSGIGARSQKDPPPAPSRPASRSASGKQNVTSG